MDYRECRTLDEFWGGKFENVEYIVTETYRGEVYNMIKEKVENFEIEVIPDELEVVAVDMNSYKEQIFTICPFDYLTEDGIKIIKDRLKELEE